MKSPPRVIVGKSDVLAGIAVVAGLAACGVVGAGLWWLFAPTIRVEIAADAVLLGDPQPEEYLGSDTAFLMAMLLVALVAPFVVWRLRRFRGPVMLVALAAGLVACAWVAWKIGEKLGEWRIESILDSSSVGDHPRLPLLQLRLTGFLFIPAIVAVICYGLLAVTLSSPAKLGRMIRRAKIVCTIGPATASQDRVRALVAAGMDVARLNFSHGTHAQHAEVVELVRRAAAEADRAVGILADLQGPKIRLGTFANGPVEWTAGSMVTITTEQVVGTKERVSTTYSQLAAEVKPGNQLLVDDGRLELEVVAVSGSDIQLRVIQGGLVSDHKGLSLPNVALSIPALTDKDDADLRFALDLDVDLIALSFVRSPDDIKQVHAVMDKVGKRLPVLAKLEKPEALEHLEQIVLTFDGLMVARGDLGVELPLEAVPLVQKRAVQLCRENARPVIVATQMLDSMIDNPRPTRAEASDVANAVLDGADALMLSGETSVGRYPVLSVHTMARIIQNVEAGDLRVSPLQHAPRTQGGAIAVAARQIGEVLGTRALVAFTLTGDTVRRLSRLQSYLPLLAFTPRERVRNQLALVWGVQTFLTPEVEHTDDMVRQVDSLLRDNGLVQTGDKVVIVAGSPPKSPGSTNALRVHTIGVND